MKLQHGDRNAIETSIKRLGDEARNLRYEIRIKQEELKELNKYLKQATDAQKWRKEKLKDI